MWESCSRPRGRGPSVSPRRMPPGSGRSSCVAPGTGSRRSSPSLRGRGRRCRARRCGRSFAKKGSRGCPSCAGQARAGARTAGGGEGARPRGGGLADRGHDPNPARRPVPVGPGAGRARSARTGRRGRLAVHQPACGDPLGAVAAGAQALRAPPAKPRALGRARPGAGRLRRTERAAQDLASDDLLLSHQPLPADRVLRGAAAPTPGGGADRRAGSRTSTFTRS